ncbi:MAG: glycosyltransferase, partial [Alphaproteobacteria bacterium]
AALQRFAHVSTISPNMRQKVIEKGVAEDKALLIQNWANVEQFDPAKGAGKWADEFKKDPDTVLAVYSGNLGKKQGLGTLIEAARLLQNEKHIHFVICGDGAGRADMVENARNLSNVTFLPLQPMDDFVHLMIAADIHLLPQKAGAADLVMPSKLGNILASGRPVVAGANKGTQLYEAMRGCGIAVPPEEGKAFAEAIRILAGDQDLRISMGKDGRGRAFAEWSKDSVLQIMERVMRH